MRHHRARTDDCAVADAMAAREDADVASDPHIVTEREQRAIGKRALRDDSAGGVVEYSRSGETRHRMVFVCDDDVRADRRVAADDGVCGECTECEFTTPPSQRVARRTSIRAEKRGDFAATTQHTRAIAERMNCDCGRPCQSAGASASSTF